MEIIGGLDVHRKQITLDYVEIETGEVRCGEIRPATREQLRGWLSRFEGKQAAFALEATTGWRFVVEQLEEGAGVGPHLAEPADTRALRGPKKRAKTDRLDAKGLRHLMRELLHQGRLPRSWIPPPSRIPTYPAGEDRGRQEGGMFPSSSSNASARLITLALPL